METIKQDEVIKKTFWGAAVFYILIAFEFIYMASPFAVYFYSVYKPALEFFNESPSLAWLISFFMPHVAETSFTIINIHNILGATLAVLGFSAFCIGAGQIYYYKLVKKGVVTGGIYNFIRHPQYVSLIVSGFGLLILWPRYIVLIMFVTMLFVYYLLARAEEKECELKFGQSYMDYKNKTNMFLPFKISLLDNISLAESRLEKVLAMLFTYVLILTLAIGMAEILDDLTLDGLYAYYSGDSVYISVNKLEKQKLARIIKTAAADKDVMAKLEINKRNTEAKFLNYVLPSEWYVPEIPMNGINGVVAHSSPSNYNKNLYKIIFNKVELRRDQNLGGKSIIRNVRKRIPLVEVWVDLAENRVVKIKNMPKKMMYENIPVAIY